MELRSGVRFVDYPQSITINSSTSNSRESEFPPTKTDPSSVGAISESRPLHTNFGRHSTSTTRY